MRLIGLFFVVLSATGIMAQVGAPGGTSPVVDTVAAAAPVRVTAESPVPMDSTVLITDWRAKHSPGRAALLSAVVPGAGQAYNRKYWKVPIAWAGLGVSYWFVQRNTKEYRRYKDAYVALVDNDPTTTDEFNGRIGASQLLDVTDTYRKWRDISYIALGAVYIMNIVDASVDAHFVRFDVGRDLTLDLAPSTELAWNRAVGLRLGLHLR